MPPATSQSPPTIDPVAARRWALQPRHVSAWLHEEVARRMAERLDVIRLPVRAWADWEPVRGGLAGHQLVAARYPDAACFQVLAHAPLAPEATKKRANDWWRKWSRQQPEVIDVAQPPAASVQFVTRGQRQPGATSSKACGNRLAERAGRAGNHHHLIVEAHGVSV